MKVFTVNFGHDRTGYESLSSIWRTEEGAVHDAEKIANGIMEDADLKGTCYVTTERNRAGQPIVSIRKNKDGEAIEWWRISEDEVRG